MRRPSGRKTIRAHVNVSCVHFVSDCASALGLSPTPVTALWQPCADGTFSRADFTFDKSRNIYS